MANVTVPLSLSTTSTQVATAPKRRGRKPKTVIVLDVATSNASGRALSRYQVTNALPSFGHIRSAIQVFGLVQGRLCTLTELVHEKLKLPKIQPDQLSNFLAGERDITAQALESLELAISIYDSAAWEYYQGLKNATRKQLQELTINQFSPEQVRRLTNPKPIEPQETAPDVKTTRLTSSPL